MLWRVIVSFPSLFQLEWSWQVELNFWRDNAEELIEIVLPKSVVRQAIMITLITHQVTHVQIVHTEVREPVSNGESLAKHHQACQCQTLLSCLSIFGISTKISQEGLIINPIPNVGTILLSKLSTILAQGVWIDVIHTIVFYQDAIVAVSVRVTYHGFNLILCTVIVTFIIAPICAFVYIAIQVDRLYSPVCLSNTDADNLHASHINNLYIAVNEDVLIHLVAVDGVPEVCDYLTWFVHTKYRESLSDVLLLQVFIHAKQNQSTYCIGKSRIRLPNRLRHFSLRFLTFQRHSFAF